MKTSYLNDWNADLLDEYYQRWKQDPASIDSSWSAFFEGFELGSSASRNGKSGLLPEREGAAAEFDRLQERVDDLVQNYRILGHTQAQIDPLAQARPETAGLDPGGSRFGGCASRYGSFIPLFSAIAFDDAWGDDRRLACHLLRTDRCRVHAHPERNGAGVGPRPDGNEDHLAAARCRLSEKAAPVFDGY